MLPDIGLYRKFEVDVNTGKPMCEAWKNETKRFLVQNCPKEDYAPDGNMISKLHWVTKKGQAAKSLPP